VCTFVLVDSNPECREVVEMPANRFHPSYETKIHENFTEDVAGHSCSEEDVEEVMVRLVEPLDGQVELLVNAFDVGECLRAWYVHLDHWSRWARNVLRARLPSGWRR